MKIGANNALLFAFTVMSYFFIRIKSNQINRILFILQHCGWTK